MIFSGLLLRLTVALGLCGLLWLLITLAMSA